mgnify:CR=1 FL=1
MQVAGLWGVFWEVGVCEDRVMGLHTIKFQEGSRKFFIFRFWCFCKILISTRPGRVMQKLEKGIFKKLLT